MNYHDIVIVDRYESGASLSSYISTAISMIHTLRSGLHGKRAAVDLHGAKYYRDERTPPDLWSLFADPPCGVTLREAVDANAPRLYFDEPAWLAGRHNMSLPLFVNDPVGVQKLQAVVPQFLRLNRDIMLRAERLFRENNLNPALTVAVSYRGTDKYTETPITPIENFYPRLDQLMLQPSLTIFAQCEEQSVQDLLMRRYRGRIVSLPFHRTRSASQMADGDNPKSNYDKTVDIATLIAMFSMCLNFVRNRSNLADLASGLSRGNVFCV